MTRALPLWTIAVGLGACGGAAGVVTPPPPPAVASVTLSQTAATLTPTQTVTLVATTKDATGTVLTGRTISWASSAAAVATVNGSGLVTAIAVGSAVVTATSEGQNATAQITVAATVVPVASVTLNQSTASLASGQTVTLVATTKDASGNVLTGRGVTWSSTATAVATVDGNGVVTPVAVGTTTVTATSEGKSASATITVAPGTFLGPAGGTATGFSGNATVTIPAGALGTGLVITIGQVANPQADPKLAPGTAYDFGPTGTTFSAPVTLAIKYDPALLVAGTNQAQLRVHKLVGTTWTPLAGSTVNTVTHVVTGATSSFSTYAVLEVLIPVGIVAITPNPVDLPLGMQVQLTAITKDAQGNVLTGRTVTWQSSVGATATIGTTTGLVTSNAIGATVVTATSEGIPTTMTLNVRSDPSARTLSMGQGNGYEFVTGIGLILTPNATSACAIGADQKGYCWGSGGNGIGPGTDGRIGDGTGLDRSVPTAISLAAPLVAITVGAGNACALDTTQNVWCWGLGGAGEYGNGTFDAASPIPVRAGGSRKFLDISAGSEHVCGIDVAGGTYCWGYNRGGNLGLGFISNFGTNTPTRVVGDPGFVSVSVGTYGTCALTVLGAPYCWGSLNLFSQGPIVPTLVAGAPAFARISKGAHHACGLTMNRHIYCWGDNDVGQLGDGTLVNRSTPTLISGVLTWRFVAAGAAHTCAITTDNRTFCWGQSLDGETGNGTLATTMVPTQVAGTLPPLAVVAGGLDATCGLSADGTGYCWGLRGNLGDGDYGYSQGPTLVLGAQNAVDVLRGNGLGCYTRLVLAVKQLMCWGENEAETSPQTPSFGAVAANAVAAAAFSSGFQCIILSANGHVSCWGENAFGALGNGTTTAATVPTPIASAKAFTQLALGSTGACGLSTANELICWGNSSPTPAQILPAINWVSVWGGAYGPICAISSAGAAYCGPAGSLTLVPGSQTWTMMATGNGFGAETYQCGLSTSGDAYCMGNNLNGQVGDGTFVTRTSMVPVVGGLKFAQIFSGYRTTCGLTAAGVAYCWGGGGYGELGTVGLPISPIPVLVPGGLHFTKLASGFDGTCGVTTDGLVYCWGTERASSLGNGELDDRRTPVPMIGGIRFLLYEPGTVNLRALRAKQP